MSLKDASGFNVQFRGPRPIFIDTLSFESYREGTPWVAYRQFCQHFLAPLALMSRVDPGLNQLLRTRSRRHPPGPGSARLLPWRTRLRPGLLLHVHLHAGAKRAFDAKAVKPKERPFPKTALLGMLDSLRSIVHGLRWEPAGTEWADYYNDTNYTDAALAEKERLVGSFLDRVAPETAWDLGANTGRFSRLASARAAASTVAFDVDPAAVEAGTSARSSAMGRTGSSRSRPRPDQSLAPASAGGTASGSRSPSGVRPTSSWPWRWCITWRSGTTSRCRRSPKCWPS